MEVALVHGTSVEVLAGIRNGSLDAGTYIDGGEPDPDVTTIEVSRFGIYVAAPPGLVAPSRPLDWKALAELPWIYPSSGTCCAQAAESLFKAHEIRPRRIISIDAESVTRTLIAGGVGIGLLHSDTAVEAESRGEVELLCESDARVRLLFAFLASRVEDPLLRAASSIVRAGSGS